MCITFFFTNCNNPTFPYKFILINNRDEFYARLTTEAELKSVGTLRTIHGTDIEAIEHGTWLGLSQQNETIKIGNLLNVPGEAVRENVKGRGAIAIDFIKSQVSIEEYNRKLVSSFDDFNGFNFLAVEIKPNDLKAFNACNIDQSLQSVPTGYHGISNSPFSSPFLKVVSGKLTFQELIESQIDSNKETLINSLLNLLKCESKHLPCSELFRCRPNDAEVFSSIHVKYPNVHYGTRNRSVILVDHFHNVDYVEERMVNEDPVNAAWERKHLWIEGLVRPKGMLPYLLGFRKIMSKFKARL